MASLALFIAFVALGGGFVGWLGYATSRRRRRRRAEARLAGGPGKLADGEVATVVGTVRTAGRMLEAPVSGKPCVAYQARARVWYGGETPDDMYTRIELVPFELETETGTVLVDAERAELLFPIIPLIPRRVEREAAFAVSCGLVPAMREISCDEICVEVGSKVAVHGVVTLEVTPAADDAGYRQTASRARIGPHPEHQLTIGAPR